ncbi:MAG: hypothetical protein JWN25_1940 [Verrucomicrobiales bacterium]|nr:hypothetical protein [Verrucomicrobiales bacterium]
MHLLYPNNPVREQQPDPMFAAEVQAVRNQDFGISLFSHEDFQTGTFSLFCEFPNGAEILYRGWMLTGAEYGKLADEISKAGGRMAVDTEAYLGNHHLPLWYPLLSDLTPETRILSLDCDLELELSQLHWPEYFVKDYVKPLKTSVGARITKPEESALLIAEMKKFRGMIEGGYCVRRVESFLPETEKRYFVLDGVPHSADSEVPEIVLECARRLPGRFYSVDVVRRSDGVERVVEVGDGQVSDLVGWDEDEFALVLAGQFLD